MGHGVVIQQVDICGLRPHPVVSAALRTCVGVHGEIQLKITFNSRNPSICPQNPNINQMTTSTKSAQYEASHLHRAPARESWTPSGRADVAVSGGWRYATPCPPPPPNPSVGPNFSHHKARVQAVGWFPLGTRKQGCRPFAAPVPPPQQK